MLAERKRLSRERGQHLGRHPHRCCSVLARIAIAPVRAPEAGEIAKRARRWLDARRDEGLDRPGCRLGVGASPVGELEAAVGVLQAAEKRNSPRDRPPSHALCAERLDDRGRVVGVR